MALSLAWNQVRAPKMDANHSLFLLLLVEVCTCFNDLKGMITRVFDHLVPGGWAEFQDAEL